MPEQVIWTALPNGVIGEGDERRLRLSVFVSPRLRTPNEADGQLGQFEDFRNWPRTMAATTFDVELEGAMVEGAAPVNVLEPDRWAALFHDETLVRSHRFRDHSTRPVISYPTRPFLNDLARLYGSMALNSPAALPSVSRGKAGKKKEEDSGLRDALRTTVFHPRSEDVQGQTPLARFVRFHDRGTSRPDVPGSASTAEARESLLDFHQAVSCLGDYPELLRSLGLVFDLELPAAALAPSATPRALRVLPRWTPGDPSSPTPDRLPHTSTIWDGSSFTIASVTEALDGGLLALDGGAHDLVQVDLDGAVEKLRGLVLNLAHQQTMAAPDTPQRTGLPAVRSAGLSVVEVDRGRHISLRLRQIKGRNDVLESDAPEQALFALEEVLRGFRIDVWDSRSETWHSLCGRIGEYHFQETGALLTLEDEGFVQLAASGVPSGPPSPPQPDLYLHESMLRWGGWSLVTCRPGKSLSAESDPTAQPTTPANDPLTPFKLKTSFRPPPRSLPRLRFGVGYRIRARAVDLAGNGLTLGEAGEDHALPLADPGRTYLRYDPVPAPVLVLRAPLTRSDDPGESLERLVIRTANRTPALDGGPAGPTSDRHVAPPRTTVDMAEAHGMFDAPVDGMRVDAPTHAMIAARDDGQFPQQGGAPVVAAPQLTIPYLPDVLARGAALRDLPGAPEATVGALDAAGQLVYQEPPVVVRPGSVTMIDFGPPQGWPALVPFRLALAEGAGEPAWDAAARVLTVQLPKATTARVALSSYFDRSDLDLMGVWEWFRQHVDGRIAQLRKPAALRALARAVAHATQRAIEGGHWMLTPARDVVLVHAVQQPLGHPTIETLVADRRFEGATRARFEGNLRVHGRSTAKIDLLASWSEFVDSGPEPEKGMPTRAYVAELPLREIEASPDAGDETTDVLFGDTIVGTYDPGQDRILMTDEDHPLYHFGDTKHRSLEVRAVATSRFAEYFHRSRVITLTGTQPVSLEAGGIAPGSELVRTPDGATTFARADEAGAGDYRIDAVAGTVARTEKSAISDGSAVQAEFLPPVSRESVDTVTVHVPSSARPAPPHVLYVVPLFEWNRQTRTNVLASERRGGWLRVYLDRPWYSSGEGELLGVVTAGPAEPGDRLKPYLTRHGRDPVRTGAAPSPLRFPNAVVMDSGPANEGLSLQEVPASDGAHRVRVHAHEVHFNPVRGLWFSDIRIDAGRAFEPFVRLSLARYQPHSLGHVDVKLSRVVLADFAQLPSGRSVVATFDPARPPAIRLVVSGRTYLGTAESTGKSRVEIEVAERREGVDGEVAWRRTSEATVEEDEPQPATDEDAILWRGVVTLPPDRSVEDFRLLVKEFDTLVDDAGASDRLLYADALDLEALTVQRGTTATALASSPNPSAIGQAVTLVATVRPERASPVTGRITFADGGTELESVSVEDGSAAFVTSQLSAGVHELTAHYRGNEELRPSVGSVVHTVEKAGTTVDVIPRLEIHGTTPF